MYIIEVNTYPQTLTCKYSFHKIDLNTKITIIQILANKFFI